jgi:N-acetylmuramic acid 6-phosphate (MurNAc-6-P) etherase
LLDDAGGSVRTAIVMGVRSVDRSQAEKLLKRHNGVIGRALAASGQE